MRKYLFCLFILVLLVTPLFASMYMFQMDHPVYDEMDALYVMEGKAAAMGIRPWSDTDVRHMLQDVKPKSSAGKALKERIESYLEDVERKNTRFLLDLSFTPGFAFHTNPDDFDAEEDWYTNNIQDDTLADAGIGLSYKENIYGYMDFSIGLNYAGLEDISDNNVTEDDIRYNEYFSTNILGVSEGTFSANMPYRALLVAGADGFRVNVGRDRLSWGNGMMGNLMLGDTLPYHNFFSATFTGSEHFSYQMLISFFAHSSDYINEGTFSGSGPDIGDDVDGLRFFLGHRFEVSLFDHRLTFAINESIMYQSESGYLNPGALNPLMFLHNLYISENSNSLMTAEIEWSPFRRWSFYLQGAVDEFSLPGEKSPPDKGSKPNAWGVMAGVRGVFPAGENYFYSGFEFVYTSPYLYHRTGDDDEAAYDLYYVSSIRAYDDDDGMKILTRYLSLPYGSDAIAGLFRFGYNDIDSFKVEGDVMFMAHGIVSAYSSIREYTGSESVATTPSTENAFTDEDYDSLYNVLSDGEVEYSLIFGAGGEKQVTKWFSFDASLYFNVYWNKDNLSTCTKFDIQLAVGLKFFI